MLAMQRDVLMFANDAITGSRVLMCLHVIRQTAYSPNEKKKKTEQKGIT
jgi:hypothetical protein